MEMRIKDILSEKGVSMDWLSKETGIAKETLYRIGSGNPTIGTLQRITDALGVPFISLFDAHCPNCGMSIYPVVGVGHTSATDIAISKQPEQPQPEQPTPEQPEQRTGAAKRWDKQPEQSEQSEQPKQPLAKSGVTLLDYLTQFIAKKDNDNGRYYMGLFGHLKQYSGDTTLLMDVNGEYIQGFIEYLKTAQKLNRWYGQGKGSLSAETQKRMRQRLEEVVKSAVPKKMEGQKDAG